MAEKDFCANCREPFQPRATRYESVIYRARPYTWLCRYCSDAERSIEQARGTNDLPDILKTYSGYRR